MDYAIRCNYIWDCCVMEDIAKYQTDNTLVNNIHHVCNNISNDIDKVLNDINERNPVKLRDYTPDVLVHYGVKNLPMYENPAHIRKNILTERQARNLGLQINSRDNYHGLGKNLYIKVIANLDNPRVIFKNTINSKEFLILTMIKDNYNNNIIVPIEVETTTNSNNIKIDINRIKSVYGFDDLRGYGLNDYIKKNLSENKFIKIYEKKNPNMEITSQLDLPINNISCIH